MKGIANHKLWPLEKIVVKETLLEFLIQLYWHGMTRLQPKTLIVMVDTGDGWKEIQEYLAIYNAFKHLRMQTFKKLPITKTNHVKFDLHVDNWLISLHFLTLSWIP